MEKHFATIDLDTTRIKNNKLLAKIPISNSLIEKVDFVYVNITLGY